VSGASVVSSAVETQPRERDVIVGVRGSFEPRTAQVASELAAVMPHTMQRWGVEPAPWHPADGGGDLQSSGETLMRGWAHVVVPGVDLPLSGILRSVWDALELYGHTVLTGVVVITTVDGIGSDLATRVAGLGRTVLLAQEREVAPKPRVLATVGFAWNEGDAALQGLADDLGKAVAKVTDLTVSAVSHGSVQGFASVPDDPESPFVVPNSGAVHFTMELPVWTIDDAAWLAEGFASACSDLAIEEKLQLSISLIQ
jgi:hypothetical protein